MQIDSLKILVVDDIILNRILIKEMLAGFSCLVSEARNGKEAIEMLKKEDFDVVIIDIEMPVMNGLETTRYIREFMEEKIKNMIVVAITAHNPDLYFSHFKNAGFNDLLTKPYTFEQMEKIL